MTIQRGFSNSNSAYFAHGEVSVDLKQIHERLGHPNQASLQQTIESTTGVKLQNKEKFNCEPCNLTKTKKHAVRKWGAVPTNLLEVIESDVQGPFPVPAIDGTSLNIKFVDKSSRYVVMESIANKDAETIFGAFQKFK